MFDGFPGIAVAGKVSRHQIVALFALQDLADGIAAHGGLDGVLHIGDVDLESGGGLAVHGEVQVRLSDYAKHSDVHDSADGPHHVDHLGAFVFQGLEIFAVNLDGKLSLDAADGFLHVIGNGLGEAPDYTGDFSHFPIHGGDEFLFVLMESGPPLFFGLEVDEELAIAEIDRVHAVIGPADLRHHLRHFRE